MIKQTELTRPPEDRITDWPETLIVYWDPEFEMYVSSSIALEKGLGHLLLCYPEAPPADIPIQRGAIKRKVTIEQVYNIVALEPEKHGYCLVDCLSGNILSVKYTKDRKEQ